jgi:tetratricopeptide (TPR) repeat protein
VTAPIVDAARAFADAQNLIGLRRYAEAIPVLMSVIGRDPNNPQTWCLLAQAKLGLNDVSGSLKAAQRAAAIDPDDEWPHRLISLCYRRQKKWAKAVKAARCAVAAAPNRSVTHTTLAGALVGMRHQRREAGEVAAHAVAMAPMDPATHVCVANVAIVRRQWPLAEQAVARALQLDPNNTSAHQTRARLQGRGMFAPTRIADSAGTYAATLRIDPTTQLARTNLDLTLTTFLSRLSYLLFIAAWVLYRLPSNGGAARLLPVAGLGVAAVFAYRFIERLAPPLRTYLLRTIMRTRVRVPIAFMTIAVLLMASTVAAPSASRPGVLGVAFTSALIGRLIIMLQREGTRAGRAGTVSTSLLLFIAVALVLAGVCFAAMVGAPTTSATVLVLLAGACWLLAGFCGYLVWQRRST